MSPADAAALLLGGVRFGTALTAQRDYQPALCVHDGPAMIFSSLVAALLRRLAARRAFRRSKRELAQLSPRERLHFDFYANDR
jgi:hypothetical protein